MLIDTSGFFCLYNKDEMQHHEAVVSYDKAARRFTTSYVLAEYVHLR